MLKFLCRGEDGEHGDVGVQCIELATPPGRFEEQALKRHDISEGALGQLVVGHFHALLAQLFLCDAANDVPEEKGIRDQQQDEQRTENNDQNVSSSFGNSPFRRSLTSRLPFRQSQPYQPYPE
jgi:hypothetical protein